MSLVTTFTVYCPPSSLLPPDPRAGPWLIYQLINRATIALFVGVSSTAGFCQFVDAAKVQMLGVVPSLVKAWQLHGMTAGCDWSNIRRFSSTGETSSADAMLWLASRAGYKPIIEYCGGTEIGAQTRAWRWRRVGFF
jgi:acetyl-CoA synthetase